MNDTVTVMSAVWARGVCMPPYGCLHGVAVSLGGLCGISGQLAGEGGAYGNVVLRMGMESHVGVIVGRKLLLHGIVLKPRQVHVHIRETVVNGAFGRPDGARQRAARGFAETLHRTEYIRTCHIGVGVHNGAAGGTTGHVSVVVSSFVLGKPMTRSRYRIEARGHIAGRPFGIRGIVVTPGTVGVVQG